MLPTILHAALLPAAVVCGISLIWYLQFYVMTNRGLCII